MYPGRKMKIVLNLNPLRPQVFWLPDMLCPFFLSNPSQKNNCKSHIKIKRHCRYILNFRFFSMNNPPPPRRYWKKSKIHEDIQDSRAQLCCQRHRQKIDHRCQFTGGLDISWHCPFNSQNPCIFCNTINKLTGSSFSLWMAFVWYNYEKYTTVFCFVLFQFCFYTVKKGYQSPASWGRENRLTFFYSVCFWSPVRVRGCCRSSAPPS